MPYDDLSVYVEDKAGDLGAPGSSPAWLSPDVDIPAHPGRAVQGSNDVQIRVHSHEEPILGEKIVAEVYVCNPSLAMSPTVGSKRIDAGNLRFRPPGVAGTEPVANESGGTLTFAWTPSSSAADVDGPGHRCLVVRAFPESVTPPTSPFDVPNEQHEAQHNIEVLTTTRTQMDMSSGGAGTPDDPRHRDSGSGLWWERFTTLAAGKRGTRFVAWAFDPEPDKRIHDAVRCDLGRKKFAGFSQRPPDVVTLEPENARGAQIDPAGLPKKLGAGLFSPNRVLAAAKLDLGPRKLASVVLRFDHANIDERAAVVLHGAQWDESGRFEGGTTLVAMAPSRR